MTSIPPSNSSQTYTFQLISVHLSFFSSSKLESKRQKFMPPYCKAFHTQPFLLVLIPTHFIRVPNILLGGKKWNNRNISKMIASSLFQLSNSSVLDYWILPAARSFCGHYFIFIFLPHFFPPVCLWFHFRMKALIVSVNFTADDNDPENMKLNLRWILPKSCSWILT